MNSIKHLRVIKRLSQAELARLANTTRAAICQIEAGKRNPSLKMAEMIAQALDVPMDELCMKDKNYLKSCRDCGKKGELHSSHDFPHKIEHKARWGIFCDCQLFWETPEQAIEAWNKRV